jgi:hypothetical protein
MGSVTIRLSERAHQALKALAERDGVSLQAEVDRAVEAYRRMKLLAEANAAFAAQRAQGAAWDEEVEEREAWEGTLADDQVDS